MTHPTKLFRLLLNNKAKSIGSFLIRSILKDIYERTNKAVRQTKQIKHKTSIKINTRHLTAFKQITNQTTLHLSLIIQTQTSLPKRLKNTKLL